MHDYNMVSVWSLRSTDALPAPAPITMNRDNSCEDAVETDL
jgi:hypothetical protein